jgi:hypothetical protein
MEFVREKKFYLMDGFLNKLDLRWVLLAGLVIVGCSYWPMQTSQSEETLEGISAELSKPDLAYALFEQYLDSYTSKDTARKARLEDYEINEVRIFETDEKRLSFSITFSVRPAFSTGFDWWITGNGRQEEDWIRNKFLFVTAVRAGDVFLIESLGTGP